MSILEIHLYEFHLSMLTWLGRGCQYPTLWCNYKMLLSVDLPRCNNFVGGLDLPILNPMNHNCVSINMCTFYYMLYEHNGYAIMLWMLAFYRIMKIATWICKS